MNWIGNPQSSAPILIIRSVLACIFLEIAYRALCGLLEISYFRDSLKAQLVELGLRNVSILALLLAPVYETLLFQAAPIALIHSVLERTEKTALTVSSLLFGAAHFSYGTYYVVFAVAAGFILGKTYLSRKSSPLAAIAIVAAVHALNNAISLSIAVVDGTIPR